MSFAFQLVARIYDGCLALSERIPIHYVYIIDLSISISVYISKYLPTYLYKIDSSTFIPYMTCRIE